MRRKRTFEAVVLCLCCLFLLIGCGSGSKEKQEAYKQEGLSAISSGEYEKAAAQFQNALELSRGKITSEEIDICYYKAAALFQAGQWKEAAEVYTALIEYDHNNAVPYFLRGSIYAGERDLEKALEDYRTAVECSDEDYELHIAIYENLKTLGYEQEAAEFLNLALEIPGDQAENCLQRGRIYMILEQYDAAEKVLKKAIDKKDNEAKIYLAKAYSLRGDDAAAKDMIQSYLKSEKTTSEGWMMLGNMEMDAGNYEQALEYYQNGLKQKEISNEQELRKNEIAALERSGLYEEAKEKIVMYQKDYPQDREAMVERQFLETR